MTEARNGLTYAEAGVDIDAGTRMVDLIKPHVRKTRRPFAAEHAGPRSIANDQGPSSSGAVA